MIGVLWAYEGWQYVTFSAGEARDPQRTFPRAISIATFLLIVLYLVANLGYVRALGPIGAANSQRVAADAIGDDPRAGRGRDRQRADSRLDLQRAQRARADDAAHVLRDGARRVVLPTTRIRASAIRHAGVRDRDADGLGARRSRRAARSSSC